MRIIFACFLIAIFLPTCVPGEKPNPSEGLVLGASRTESYLPLLEGKRVGVVVNQTSVVDSVHLVNFLLSKQVNITAIYAPEHGYKGTVERGEYIESSTDSVTGLPVFSIYGRTRKPTPEMLQGIDVMVFDIQDIGVRFFTVISTMSNVMEACAENGIKVIILDRPNPLGYYVDGPVMKPEFSNFIGLHQVPVVHGMTLGEYACMVNGEGWLKDSVKCELEVITVENYTHDTKYQLPVVPSPNLPDMKSVYLYPMVCFFEGAEVNEGRGTWKPFQQFGTPWFTPRDHTFVPVSIPVLSLHPKFENDTCYGYDLSGQTIAGLQEINQVRLNYLIEFYQKSNQKELFFTDFFENLAGSDTLRKQIMAGQTEEQIRESWQSELDQYKEMRKKYLLYD
ncbi:MAG: exo-beta-N-acetylmuramidase NamZ domain-containing protein [Mangrovibacterium sp.]